MGLYEEKFNSALLGVSEKIATVLMKLLPGEKEEIQEIRIRRNKAVALTKNGENFYLLKNACLSKEVNNDCVFASKEDIEQTFKLLVRSSVYSHLEEIKEGYVIMRGGHRAGICGSYLSNGSMGNISSVNIRVAKEVFGCAFEIAKGYIDGGLLIAGPPGSGKTTLLRDFIRITAKQKRICVVDTRGEISASHLGESFNDLGQNTDILVGYPKDKGIFMAVRTMFPQIVAFDEFSTFSEYKQICDGFLLGVDIVSTVHIGSENDLLVRPLTKKLLTSGVIKTVVLLNGSPCKEVLIKSANELVKKCGN